MLTIRNGRLPTEACGSLRQYQQDVDAQPDYATRVARAKSQFSRRNRTANAAFRDVRSKLTDMCNGSRRCMYCEDSVADEVEHFRPKDLYPEEVFVWGNYLYACGPCNAPKNNKFSVIDANTDQLVDVTRARGAPIVPPQNGGVALINPRREDPLEFMMLDIRDTFEFTPLGLPGSIRYLRATYTIDILNLNGRDYLIDARNNAFGGYRARLNDYVVHRNAGAPRQTLAQLRRGIRRCPHPTVWAEMKRQHQHHQALAILFEQAPEALGF